MNAPPPDTEMEDTTWKSVVLMGGWDHNGSWGPWLGGGGLDSVGSDRALMIETGPVVEMMMNLRVS
jgi:hypothetical protein